MKSSASVWKNIFLNMTIEHWNRQQTKVQNGNFPLQTESDVQIRDRHVRQQSHCNKKSSHLRKQLEHHLKI